MLKTLTSIFLISAFAACICMPSIAGTVKKSQTFGIGGNGDALDVPFTIANLSSGNITENWSDNRGNVGTAQTFAPGVSQFNELDFGTASIGGSGTITVTVNWYPGSSASGTPFETDTLSFQAPGSSPLEWPFSVCYSNSPVYPFNVPTDHYGDIPKGLILNSINNSHLSAGTLQVSDVPHAITYQNGLTTDANGANPAGLTDLNSIIGGSQSSAVSINDKGDVMGETVSSGNVAGIFVYSASSNTATILPSGDGVTPEGMNASDNVVGYGSITDSSNSDAIVYLSGTPTDLETANAFPSGTLDSTAFAINDSNEVVGTYTDGSHAHAFTWTPGSSTVTALPDGAYTSLAATSINNTGIITGSGYDSDSNFVALYWDSAGIHEVTNGSESNQQVFVNDFSQMLGNDDTSFWIASPATSLVELNSLISNGAEYFVPSPLNDLGEFSGYMADSTDDIDAVVVTPVQPLIAATVSGTKNSAGTYTSTPTVTLTTTPNTGQTISGTYFTLDGGAKTSYSGQITISGDSVHTLNYWCADQYGNPSLLGKLQLAVDVAGPTTTATLSGTSGSNGYYLSSVKVTLTATGPYAIAATYYTVDGGAQQTYTTPFTVSGDALHTIKFWSVDVESVTEAMKSASINIDSTTPVTTATVVSYSSGTTVTLSATDNVSGVASTYYQVDGGTTQTYSAPFTVTGAGTHSISYWSVDKAGNTETKNTKSLTVATPLVSLTINPSTVTSKTNCTGTVTLGAMAPAGGAVVSLSSSNSHDAVAATPTVTVPAGATTATFTIYTANTGTSPVTITISATYLSVVKTATVTVNPANTTVALQSLTISPSTVTAGTHATGTVTLSGAAPTGGIVVALSSSNSHDAVPAVTTVTVAAGATTANFTIYTANSSTSPVTITLSAQYNGVTVTAPITVNPVVKLTGLTINPSTVTSASKSYGTVTISPAAPAGGITVTLSTSNSHIAVPAVSTVTIAQGATSAMFTINVANTTGSPVTVTISAAYNGVTKTANITVNPVPAGLALQSLTLSPSTVTAGTHVTGTVTLTQAAPVGGIVVALSSSNTKDAVPAVSYVTVAANATTATYTIYTANGSGSPSTITLSSEYNNVVKSATLTVNP